MASLTRVYLDTVLVDRTALLLDLFGLSMLKDGTNPVMVDPITVAMQSFGIDPMVFGVIDQSDLDVIPGGKSQQLLDLAEYRLLETLHTYALSKATVRVGTQSEVTGSDIAKNIADKMKSLKASIDAKYASDLSGLTSGRIKLNLIRERRYPCEVPEDYTC